MFDIENMECIKNDLINVSESESVEINNIIIQIKPLKNNKFDLTYNFNVNIKDYYSKNINQYIDYNNVNIQYLERYDIDILELIKVDIKKIEKIFNTSIEIVYHNYDIPYNKEMSNDLERNLQATYENIYCVMYDL